MKNHRSINYFCFAAAFLSAMILSPWFSAHAQTESFYKGKTLRFVIGSGAGAFYDQWGRLIARHWGRHIPGTPPERVKILRESFAKTMQNPELLADAKKSKMEIEYTS